MDEQQPFGEVVSVADEGGSVGALEGLWVGTSLGAVLGISLGMVLEISLGTVLGTSLATSISISTKVVREVDDEEEEKGLQ